MTRAAAPPRPAAKPAAMYPREAAARDACAWTGVPDRPPVRGALRSLVGLALAAWALVGIVAVVMWWIT